MRNFGHIRSMSLLLLAGLSLRPAVLAAQSPANVPVRSASQRFIVSGMNKEENVALATALEDVADRMEQLVAMKIPFDLGPVLRVVAKQDSARKQGRVVRAQGWVDGHLEQKLMVFNVGQLHQEDLLEALCWLLFNRCAIRDQPFSRRAGHLAEAPEWLTTGLAQNLFSSLRVRNTRVVLGEWQRDVDVAPALIMGHVFMPAGRWKEKAHAGLTVEWLTAAVPDFWPQCARRIGQSEPLTPEWVAGLLQVGSGRELNKNWDIWLAGRTSVLREWGVITSALLEECDDMLRIRPSQLGVQVDAGLPPDLSMGDLIALREKSWMRPLATRVNLRVKSLGIGQPREFQAVLDKYSAYLVRLPLEKKNGGLFGGRPTSTQELTRLLEEAETARRELKHSILERERFETLVEQEFIADSVFKVDNGVGDDDKFRRYLDEIEQQRRKEPAP